MTTRCWCSSAFLNATGTALGLIESGIVVVDASRAEHTPASRDEHEVDRVLATTRGVRPNLAVARSSDARSGASKDLARRFEATAVSGSATSLGVVERIDLELEELSCPRCGHAVSQRLYGPCAACREELGAKLHRIGRDPVEAAAYVPKMNVTPNQVATKD